MNQWNRRGLEEAGFRGFLTVRNLRATDAANIPDKPGVYAVFRSSVSVPAFLAISSGGRFKGRDPTIPSDRLLLKWVSRAPVVYVGKAGTSTGRQTLRKRVKAYLSFGGGKPTSHWGGRAIWQLKDSDELLFAWKVTSKSAARREERRMLEAFRAKFDALPFANWRV